MRLARVAGALFASTLLVGSIAAFASSCASAPESLRVTHVIEPDYPSYKANVNDFLVRRCGTLDCHGQPGRPYRVYSREGFRLYTVADGGLVSGGASTVEAEILANFQAIVGLEPEEISRAMARQGARDAILRLVFLRKPLRIERHKGGTALAIDDVGFRCVEAWLQIPVVRGDGSFIPPEQRAKMSDRAQAVCLEAASQP